MKKVFLFSFLLLLGIGSSENLQAQTLKQDITKEAKKAEKEARKLEEKMREEREYIEAVQALKNQAFVLEADRIVFRRGRLAFVSPQTNFISLSDDRAIVQVAFDGPYSGPNGMGGITIEGSPSNIQLKTDKRGNVTFSMNISGIAVSAQVSILLFNGGNEATVTVSPNFSPNRITLDGKILPVEHARIFKGRSF